MLKILNLSKQYNENNNIVLKDYSFENLKSYCILYHQVQANQLY